MNEQRFVKRQFGDENNILRKEGNYMPTPLSPAFNKGLEFGDENNILRKEGRNNIICSLHTHLPLTKEKKNKILCIFKFNMNLFLPQLKL